MSGFRLLAIIPLKGCSSKYRKNLKIGESYKFYDSHNIELNKEKSSVIKVTPNEKYDVPENLIKLKNNIDINISCLLYTSPSPRD